MTNVVVTTGSNEHATTVFEEDLKLVQKLIAGDRRAFAGFMDQYAQRLAAFLGRRLQTDASALEDVVQNTLIRAVRSLTQYRGDASLFTWLCQIGRSELVDQWRRSRRLVPTLSLHSDQAAADMVESLPAPEDCPGGLPNLESDRSDAVTAALTRIPVRYARVLEWKYGDGASVEEIGRLMGITDTAAQSLLARARGAFREAWTGRSGSDGLLVAGDSA